MCGIAAIIDPNGRVDARRLKEAQRRLRHRGPDGEGLWMSDGRRVGFAHTRLAVIEPTSAADQPFAVEGEGLRLIYNGEIYNHRSLRRTLEVEHGRQFVTDHSDTEMILHAYSVWGLRGALERFRGMFAFCLYDAKTGRVVLARDRLGIKPLYYARTERGVMVASEAKALLEMREEGARPNLEGLFHVLTFRATPAPVTCFEGVSKLEPGHCAVIDLQTGELRKERFWDLLDNIQGDVPEPVADHVRDKLRESVRLRLEADVPLGVFLSGGLDSTAILANVVEEAGTVDSFTVGYQAPESYNETGFAREVAERFGARYHETILSEDDFEAVFEKVVFHQDEPIAAPICTSVYYLAELAQRNGMKVVLAGDGSDELFIGYPHWRRIGRLSDSLLSDLARGSPELVKSLVLRAMSALWGGYRRRVEVVRRMALGLPLFWSGVEDLTEKHKMDLIHPRLRSRFNVESTYEKVVAPMWRRFKTESPKQDVYTWMTYSDVNFRLPELMLARLDRMTMAASIEGRVPFMDHEFVETVAAIPSERKIRGNDTKALLREAVGESVGPAARDREKRGFIAPVDVWKRSDFGAHLKNEVRKFNDDVGFFERDALEGILTGDDKRYFQLANIAVWHRQYFG